MRTDYERLAERYDEDRARWSVPKDAVVTALAESRELLRVLDLGCGTGRWLDAQRGAFGDANIAWLGIDPSSGMLDEARTKGIANLMRGRAENLPLADAAVDYVVTNYAFHHFEDKERALDEIARVLTSPGVFGLNNMEPAAADGWWLYEFFPEAIEVDAARFWPADRIAGALEARAFDVDVNLDAGVGETAASEALAEAQRRVVSQLALLDDSSYERGLGRLREVAASPGATMTNPRSRLRLLARRT